MKTSSSLTLEKVSKRRYVFLVIAPNVGRHAFLDRWRNAQKDGQGDQVRDRGEHSFAKLKVTYNQFLAWLKRTKKRTNSTIGKEMEIYSGTGRPHSVDTLFDKCLNTPKFISDYVMAHLSRVWV